MNKNSVGIVLAFMTGFSVLNGLHPFVPAWPAGLLAWLAGVVLLREVKGLQRSQVLAMFAVGVACMGWAASQGVSPRVLQALTANQALLSMLAAVSFLRLISVLREDTREVLPTGRTALWRTLFGLHFLGAVINMSALMIVGERLMSRKPLSRLQAIVLSRGFSTAAFWSPFFAAMAVALTYAPGAELLRLSAVGFPLAMLALLMTAIHLAGDRDALWFRGYPMHYDALWLPFALALAVLTIRQAAPHLPILTVVSLLSVSLTIVVLAIRCGDEGFRAARQHVLEGLPRMSGELTLFLAAGTMAAGIAAVLDGIGWHPQVEDFGPGHASMLLVALIGFAVLGIHPVVGISTVGAILAASASDPSLLGMAFLLGWGLGVSLSPFSGVHLAIQGRFGVRGHAYLRWNLVYVLSMFAASVAVFHLYWALTQ